MIYSSNTIPIGWLLCNGQLVSKTTYADLFAVIGYTYTLLIAPTTGNFYLPDFTGLYVRGKGLSTTHPGVLPLGQDAIVTSNTTLGQYQMSSPGDHKHFLQTVNTNTQETTGTSTVVSGVTGLAGLTLTHKVVSNGVVTTTSSTGSGDTTIYTQDTWGTIQASECRPNNISMNYIIKYGGTITPITAPSFTQATNVLTIQNNYATSGIINFQLDDASSVLTTPLSLTSTSCEISNTVNMNGGKTLNMYSVAGQTSLLRLWNTSNTNYIQSYQNGNIGIIDVQTTTGTAGTIQMYVKNTAGTSIPTISTQVGSTQISGDGTGYNFYLSQNSALSGLQLLFVGEAGINYIESALNNTTGSAAPIVFCSRLVGEVFARIDTTGVSVPTKNFFGRNDGNAFTAIPSGATTQPIGFCINYNLSITPAAATQTTLTAVLLDAGVWIVNGSWQLNRGTGTFSTTSIMFATVFTGTGYTAYPSSTAAGFKSPIPSTAIGTTYNANFSSTIVVSTAGRTVSPVINTGVVMTLGTATSLLLMGFTKIA